MNSVAEPTESGWSGFILWSSTLKRRTLQVLPPGFHVALGPGLSKLGASALDYPISSPSNSLRFLLPLCFFSYDQRILIGLTVITALFLVGKKP